MTATVSDWYREHGRHPVYAKNQKLELPQFENPLTSRVPGVPDYVRRLNEEGKVQLRVLSA